METLTYQQLIQSIIENYARRHPSEESVETQVILDTEKSSLFTAVRGLARGKTDSRLSDSCRY